VLLLILDGWGHRIETDWNAIAQANLPNWRRLLAECPHQLIDTHGEHVGLPDGQMGNSEVGHMNIGAGRVVYQELTRIDQAIRDGRFAGNPALVSAFDAVKASGGTLHVFGLMSPGGVHAQIDHVLALLGAAAAAGVTSIAVHAFTDGRDTPPKSAGASLQKLDATCAALPGARIATVSGRYYAMDRDNRWERVEPAYRAITEAQAEFRAADAMAALDAAYARGETDEFVKPTVVGDGARFADGDAVVFLNFRADRARELTRAFVRADFDGFAKPRAIALSAYGPDRIRGRPAGHGGCVSAAEHGHLRRWSPRTAVQLHRRDREARTSPSPNGGREDAFPGEERAGRVAEVAIDRSRNELP
jgi:2,3-bisphosphoglycerate-independent phosphoglycerate mutase